MKQILPTDYQYFMLMRNFNPTAEQNQRAINVAHLVYTIGNFWVLPSKAIFENHQNSSKYQGYMDRLLNGMYQVFAQQKGFDKELQGIFLKNHKYMAEYQGVDGFKKFVQNLILDDYVDLNGLPKDIFMFVWGMKKGLDTETYFNAVDQFCTFCETAIPHRSRLIVDRLKAILK